MVHPIYYIQYAKNFLQGNIILRNDIWPWKTTFGVILDGGIYPLPPSLLSLDEPMIQVLWTQTHNKGGINQKVKLGLERVVELRSPSPFCCNPNNPHLDKDEKGISFLLSIRHGSQGQEEVM